MRVFPLRQSTITVATEADGLRPAAERAAGTLLSRPYRTAHALIVSDRRGPLVTIARHGRIDAPLNVKSVTKSVLSLLVGAAILRGHLRDEHVTLGEIDGLDLPDDVPLARELTLAHLLTMRSGLRWDEWARRYRDPARMFGARHPGRYTLERGFVAAPGSAFRYSSGDSQVLASVLTAAVGEPLARFADAALFGPLEIPSPKWLAGRDGVPFGGAHLYLAPRDLVRIGRLCLADGLWGEHRLIAQGWLDRAATVQSGDDWWEGPYGYHWWVRERGYAAYGYGGQVMLVSPAAKLVCVFTAASNRRAHIPIAQVETELIDPLLDGIGSQSAART